MDIDRLLIHPLTYQSAQRAIVYGTHAAFQGVYGRHVGVFHNGTCFVVDEH
jgi:hypothetical protein